MFNIQLSVDRGGGAQRFKMPETKVMSRPKVSHPVRGGDPKKC